MKRILHFFLLVLCIATGVTLVSSYVRPLSAEFSPNKVWVHARGDLARCRIIVLVPTLSHPSGEQAYMLECYKRDQRADPRTARLGIGRIWVRWPGDETTARGLRLNFSLYIPLIVFTLPFIVPLYRAVSRRYPPPAVWQEVLRPSESRVLLPRAIHRSAIVLFMFLGMVWCIPWLAAGFEGPWSIGSTPAFNMCNTFGDVSIAVGRHRSLLFQNQLRSKTVTYTYTVADPAEPHDVDYRLGPFNIRHTTVEAFREPTADLGTTASLVPRTTLQGTLTFSGPAWAVPAGFLLSLLYPAIAAWRGPLRRARRQAWMTCPRCGYSLTGLTHPSCPECGAGLRPQLRIDRLPAFIQESTG